MNTKKSTFRSGLFRQSENSRLGEFFLFRQHDHDLMRACHQSEQRQKIKGKQRNGDMLRNQAEERGRNAKANVSERHLHADHGLRFISAEDIGCHMNDTGINGCATETDNDKADQRKQGGKRKENQKNARYDDAEPRADQKTVAEFHGKKAVNTSARRNSYIE